MLSPGASVIESPVTEMSAPSTTVFVPPAWKAAFNADHVVTAGAAA